jgi:lipopolysaccharide transport system permease protein
MEVITLSVSLFVREMSRIKGTTLPITVYVMRLTMQSLIRAAYAFVGCVAIILISGDFFHAIWLWSLVGIAIIIVATPAVIMVVAFVGAYMPDMQFVISNVMRVGMFLTPIFWPYQGTGGIRHLLYHWNPFTHFVEIFRIPIVDGTVPYMSLSISIGITSVMWVSALLLLGGLRRKVVFVL